MITTQKQKIKSSLLSKEYDMWWKHLDSLKRDAKRRSQERMCYEKVLSSIEITNGKKILDIACGWGELLALAKEKGLEVSGIDISKTAIKLAKKRINGGNLQIAQAEKLPFKENTFDYIVCIGSLEHFDSPQKALKEMSRVIRPSGKIFIRVPNLYFLGHIYMALRYGIFPSEGGQDFSERFSTKLGWKDLIEKNKLKVNKINKYNFIYATKKVNPVVISLWNLLNPLLPEGLSYCFDYICVKKS